MRKQEFEIISMWFQSPVSFHYVTCCSLNTNSERGSHPNLWNPQHVSLYGKRDFAGVIKLSILRWERTLDYPGGSTVITRVLTKNERQISVSSRICGDGGKGWSDVMKGS